MSKPKLTKGELPKHIIAFRIWYANDCDFHKTPPILAPKIRVAERTLYEWAEKFNWYGRAKILNDRANLKVDADVVRKRIEMLDRHSQTGRLLQQRGLERLKRPINDTGDALRAVRYGVDIERKAEGFPDYVAEIMGKSDDEVLEEYNCLMAEIASNTREVGGGGEIEPVEGVGE